MDPEYSFCISSFFVCLFESMKVVKCKRVSVYFLTPPTGDRSVYVYHFSSWCRDRISSQMAKLDLIMVQIVDCSLFNCNVCSLLLHRFIWCLDFYRRLPFCPYSRFDSLCRGSQERRVSGANSGHQSDSVVSNVIQSWVHSIDHCQSAIESAQHNSLQRAPQFNDQAAHWTVHTLQSIVPGKFDYRSDIHWLTIVFFLYSRLSIIMSHPKSFYHRRQTQQTAWAREDHVPTRWVDDRCPFASHWCNVLRCCAWNTIWPSICVHSFAVHSIVWTVGKRSSTPRSWSSIWSSIRLSASNSTRFDSTSTKCSISTVIFSWRVNCSWNRLLQPTGT